MMKIQPGLGHIFDSSSKGMSIDVTQQFPDKDTPSYCPLQIYGLHYDPTEDKYYIYVSPGMVNNVAATDHDGNLLTDTPPPKIQVFVDGITETLTDNYVYIAVENSGDPNYYYPDPDVAPYITIKTAAEADTDEVAFLLIGIVQGMTDLETDVDTLYTFNYKGCGSLWSERFKCGSSDVSYWWSAV